MSRPIRFRAWDKRDKKMVTGKYPCNLHGEVFFLYGFGAMAPADRPTLEYLNDIDFHQFTGCVDLDGNELYEGDVIESFSSEGDVIESFSSEGHSIKHLIWFNDGKFVSVHPSNNDKYINGIGAISQK